MQTTLRVRPSAGFTLVELLVVIGIIGTLVALLLPAVQMGREAARRTSCVNNLRQMGTAIHLYHEYNSAFPPGGVSPGTCCASDSFTCWTIQILPFLEQKALYSLYNQTASNHSKVNKAVREQFVAVYSCPADIEPKTLDIPDSGPAHDFRVQYMPGSYRGVGGRSNGIGFWDNMGNGKTTGHLSLPRRWRGVFHVVDSFLQPESFAAVLDGTSNTLMVGEYTTFASHTKTGLARRTFWAYTHTSYNRSDAVPESRALLADYDRCSEIGGKGDVETCNHAWGSMHPQALNFLLCDGSVHTFSLTIDMNLFAEAATIAGREFAPIP